MKTISFDCSGINRLTDDKESAVVLAAVKTAYFVRLTATNIDEIIATPKKRRGRRDALLDTCGKLLSAGECIFPHHFVSDILVKDYKKRGKSRWRSVRGIPACCNLLPVILSFPPRHHRSDASEERA